MIVTTGTGMIDAVTVSALQERIVTLETELAGALVYIRLCEENPDTWKPTSEGVAIYVAEVKKNHSWRKVEGEEVQEKYRWHNNCGLSNCPFEPEVKFPHGCKVRMISEEPHKRHPQWYPPAGTIGDFFGQSDDGTIQVRWPMGTTSWQDVWPCAVDYVEVVEE